MDARQKKTIGKVVGGCGCFLLLLITAWMGFVVYVGIEGRRNDEETSMVIGAITCVCTIPIVILTAAGLYFGLREDRESSGPG